MKIIMTIIGAVIILLGLYMAIFSQNATKEEKRYDDGEVFKTRRNGIMLSLFGIIVIVYGLL